MNLYCECRVCSAEVDASVSREFCPFCGTPVAKKFGQQVREGIGIGTIAVSQALVPTFSNELPTTYGALDLYIRAPHEHIHSTSSTDKIGELTRPITNVTSWGPVSAENPFQTTKPSA